MLNQQLFPEQNAFIRTQVVLTDTIMKHVHNENWKLLDKEFLFLTGPDQALFNFFKTYLPQLKSIEFIINIRDADNDYEEDGIWHDDGSRELAFSIGLNQMPKNIEGGKLNIRKKNTTEQQEILPPSFGECYIFKTGIWGYEHKVTAVTKGRRIVVAGWCSL